MLSDGQSHKYLCRLGVVKKDEPSRPYLDELIAAHQKSIPFETIRLHREGKLPDLSVESIFEAVIEEGLGGYCFELNTLFAALLAYLGFDVRAVLCRSVRGRDGLMPINHKGLLVTLDAHDYFVDVGFGGPMAEGSLDIGTCDEQVVNEGTYFVTPKDESWYKVERITRGAKDLHDDGAGPIRQTELEFCIANVEDLDFNSLNLAFSSPGTLFRDHEIVNLRTDGGNLAYKDGVLTIRQDGQKTIKAFDGLDAQNEALSEYFGLDYK